MGKHRNRVVQRDATRKSPAVSMVLDNPASGEGGDPPPSGLILDAKVLANPVAAATALLLAEIADARDPLAAELVLCAAFGALEAGLPDDADGDERLEALTMFLGEVISHAHALASEDALALLRVCSVLGPPTTRAAAGEMARQLATAGVADRSWAGTVGRPTMLRAWRNRDLYGTQSSVGVLFDYRGREHALMVLVDHVLGGGIKDCWVTEGRSAKSMRNTVAAAMADEPEAVFEDIDPAAFAELLGSALTNPPCPEQDDQIDDVACHLYLLRARVEHVAQVVAGRAPAEGRDSRPS